MALEQNGYSFAGIRHGDRADVICHWPRCCGGHDGVRRWTGCSDHRRLLVLAHSANCQRSAAATKRSRYKRQIL